MKKKINNWKSREFRSPFINLVGDPGSGRRIIVDSLINKYSDLNPIVLDVTGKITTKNQLDSFLKEVLDNDQKNDRLVFITNFENLFLNTPGGFDALKEFFKYVNRDDNIFWINIVDYFPWEQIQGFFKDIYENETIKLSKFSDRASYPSQPLYSLII